MFFLICELTFLASKAPTRWAFHSRRATTTLISATHVTITWPNDDVIGAALHSSVSQ